MHKLIKFCPGNFHQPIQLHSLNHRRIGGGTSGRSTLLLGNNRLKQKKYFSIEIVISLMGGKERKRTVLPSTCRSTQHLLRILCVVCDASKRRWAPQTTCDTPEKSVKLNWILTPFATIYLSCYLTKGNPCHAAMLHEIYKKGTDYTYLVLCIVCSFAKEVQGIAMWN